MKNENFTKQDLTQFMSLFKIMSFLINIAIYYNCLRRYIGKFLIKSVLKRTYLLLFYISTLLDKLTAVFGDEIQIIIMHKKMVGLKSDCVINEDTFSQLQEYEHSNATPLLCEEKSCQS